MIREKMINYQLQVAKSILTDVDFDMDSLASGFESGPAHKTDEHMRWGDGQIHGAGKKKRRLSKKDRKKSSTYGKQVS